MSTLWRMLIRSFIPLFLIAVMFFVLLLELIDLFTNLPRYISLEVDIMNILRIGFLYIPKCISFSVPVGLLFAISYTLGNLYSSNQLISIFGSGVSLFRFILPFILTGILLSFATMVFEENLVIETYTKKNILQMELLKQKAALSKANVCVLSSDNSVVYIADYYNDNAKTLSSLTVLKLSKGRFSERIESDWAEWKESLWVLHSVRLFKFDDRRGVMTEEYLVSYSDAALTEAPTAFQNTSRKIAEMRTSEATEWLHSLKRGDPALYAEALTDYYRRFFFACTPFIVTLIASSLGGRFKKNILLMSLVTSLCISVLYYVLEMVTVLLAKHGYISPMAGASFPGVFFLAIGFFLFRLAPT